MRIMFIYFQVLILVLACNVKRSYSQELNSTLRFTEYGVPFAFVGETITFTCRTEMSNSIGWSSSEYIGVNRLNFASVEPDGTTRPPTDSGAVAQLVSSSRVNGTVILVSQLQIIVQSEYQIASISCHNIGIDEVSTTSFRIAVNTSVTCDVSAVCPGERFLCSCTTAYSDFLAWSIINDGGKLVYRSGRLPQLKPRRIMSNSSISAEISSISVSNEVVVLKSELSLPFLLESRYIILRCENIEDHDSYSAILPVSRKCPPSAIFLTTTMDEPINATQTGSPPTDQGASGVSIGVAVTTGFVVPLAVLFVAVVVLYIIYMYMRKRHGRSYFVDYPKAISHTNEDDEAYVTKHESNEDQQLERFSYKTQRIEKDSSSTDEDLIIMQTNEAPRIENNSSTTDMDLITMQTGKLAPRIENDCLTTDMDLIIMQTGEEANEVQETHKKTLSNPSVEVFKQKIQDAFTTPVTVRKEEDCSRNTNPFISTDEDLPTMQISVMGGNANQAHESDEKTGISSLSLEGETVIPQLETGGHPSSVSFMRSFNLMECTERPTILYKRRSLDASLDQDELIRKLREEIQQLKKKLSEKEQQIAELEKNMTKMIPLMTDGASAADEDSQEVWKRDCLLVAHTGNLYKGQVSLEAQ